MNKYFSHNLFSQIKRYNHRLVSMMMVLGLTMGSGVLFASEPVTTEAVTPSAAVDGAASDEAAVASVTPAQRAALEQRVQARWQALIRRDFAAAYAFETPAYRELWPLESFTRRYGKSVAWQGVTIKDITFNASATVAQVVLMLGYTAQLPDGNSYPGRRRIDEAWVLIDDQWWLTHDLRAE
jgi:hypothetical protein